MIVEHMVESPCFDLVALDAVFDLLRSVAMEVVGLTLHWSYPAIEEEQLFESVRLG